MVAAVGFAHALAKLADWKDCDDVSRAIWAARWCAGACDSTTEWTMWLVNVPPAITTAVPTAATLTAPAPPSTSAARSPPPCGSTLGVCCWNHVPQPGDAADVCERRGRQRQEGRGGRALELAPAHFAAQLAVDPPARDASGHMGSRACRVMIARLAGSVGGNRVVAELAHSARRRDRGDASKLELDAAIGSAYLAEGESEVTGSGYGTDPVSRHHGKDLALARVELGDQVGRAGHAIGQLDRVERISGSGSMLDGGFEVDTLT